MSEASQISQGRMGSADAATQRWLGLVWRLFCIMLAIGLLVWPDAAKKSFHESLPYVFLVYIAGVEVRLGLLNRGNHRRGHLGGPDGVGDQGVPRAGGASRGE